MGHDPLASISQSMAVTSKITVVHLQNFQKPGKEHLCCLFYLTWKTHVSSWKVIDLIVFEKNHGMTDDKNGRITL